MSPLVWLLNTITRLLMRMAGIKTQGATSWALSKEELHTIVYESRSLMSRRNQNMLLSVLDLEKVSVDDIMISIKRCCCARQMRFIMCRKARRLTFSW
nr:magnesium/cobalt efflux protein [Candidatus Pantoea persica]